MALEIEAKVAQRAARKIDRIANIVKGGARNCVIALSMLFLYDIWPPKSIETAATDDRQANSAAK